MALNQNRRRLLIVCCIVYISLIALAVATTAVRGIGGLLPVYIINISMDIFGLVLGFILFASLVIDVQKSGLNQKYYLLLLSVVCLGLFCDAEAWLLDGVRQTRPLCVVDNYLYYACNPTVSFCFWIYVSSLVKKNSKRYRALDRLMLVGYAVSLLLIASNLFTEFYFTVDAEAVYRRNAWYPLSMAYAVIAFVTTILLIVSARKQLKLYEIVILLLYLVSPLGAILIALLIYGLSLSYTFMMASLLLMYCVLNVAQGQKKALADRDLALASSIQESSLPRTFPYLPERTEFDLYASMKPAKEVGGDFYDFFMIDGNRLALVIADVSGKGIPAALFMMVARTLIKSQTLSSLSDNPGEIFAAVNERLCEGNEMELFVTAWLGILELDSGLLRYANAGHEYPALCRKGEQFDFIKERHSPPLAAMEGIRYRQHELQLGSGDRLLVYTDGVAEATDGSNTLFGETRTLAALNENPTASPEELLAAVKQSIDDFVGGAEQFDDITMLCLEYSGLQK